MRLKRIHVSLQTKILGLVLTLNLFLIALLTGCFTVMENRQIQEQKGQLALDMAITISNMPTIKNAFKTKNPSKIIQPLAEKIRKETKAEFIVIGNKQGIRYSHPITSRIGQKMVGGDNYRAIKKGEAYISKAKGSLGPSLRGKAPIFNEKGEIIGLVSVGYLLEDVKQQIARDTLKVGIVSFIALVISFLGSFLLARNIRKETMGLEPYEIAALYKEKNAILQSVKEGIIAVDQNGFITAMNQQAKKLLHITGSVRHRKVDPFFPCAPLYEVMETGMAKMDQEISWKDKTIIVSITPILNEQGTAGAVASFRDKTDVEQMVNTLSEVKRYSEDLRAQTHEFTNKLYVLSGLIQLGEYSQAVQMIQEETAVLQNQNKIIFDHIKDTKVQAILLGKIGKASEKKIRFEIDPNSDLQTLPDTIKLSHLIVILGNLMDNAFEAVAETPDPRVTFFATDLGDDIIFEIIDNGRGIPENDIMHVLERGFTTKGGKEPRGFGLNNVEKAVKDLGGIMEVQSTPNKGSVFTVYLPKKQEGADQVGHHKSCYCGR
ncbi:sensor histidine kinase [Bacillus sp. FSL W8-0116]|uniref:sensor histidine kinase n=1 Tax=Bacillus sp. FSL W8-0116 TaxID=2978206 RepID=UPI0030F66898